MGGCRDFPPGQGIRAEFAHGSGTGKALAAEVLANQLRLDPCRVDLSQAVGKYIGETERDLRRVFDATKQGGVVLLFDEDDELFRKRSEVKDSQDRYPTFELSYLLQRMESYRGLTILTTNMKSALDSAFLGRIRSIVRLSLPRTRVRAKTCPPPSPTPPNAHPRLPATGGAAARAGEKVLAVAGTDRQAAGDEHGRAPLRLRTRRALGKIPMLIPPPSPTHSAERPAPLSHRGRGCGGGWEGPGRGGGWSPGVFRTKTPVAISRESANIVVAHFNGMPAPSLLPDTS